MNASLLVASIAALFTTPTAAEPVSGTTLASASYGLRLEGFVPVTCRVRVGQSQVSGPGTQVDLGGLTEFCNSAGGYDTFVDYGPQLVGAKLLVDGTPVALGPSGTVRLDGEAGPARRERSLVLELSDGSTLDGALSFRIVTR